MNIVIIGAGECGVRAAFALRDHGHDGAITLISNEAVLPYERPPLSKGSQQSAKLIRPQAVYTDANIDLKLSATVERIETEEKKLYLSNGVTLPYDQLLLATGARARLFDGMEHCQTLRTDEDARRIQSLFVEGASIGIVGGGFIGLELAASAKIAGVNVTVVEAGDRILERAVPALVSSFVHEHHRRKGVEIITGVQVLQTCATGISLDDGRRLEFDAVLAGVGALPNSELAESAGLLVNNGIVVDASFRTSNDHIFAAGDCCNFKWNGERIRLESWKAAQDQGEHVANAMLGAAADYQKVPWFWSDQFDLTLQVAGIFDQSAEIHRRACPDNSCIVFQCDQANRLLAVAGVGSGNAVAKDLKIMEKLIERNASVSPMMLADSTIKLKQLLKQS